MELLNWLINLIKFCFLSILLMFFIIMFLYYTSLDIYPYITKMYFKKFKSNFIIYLEEKFIFKKKTYFCIFIKIIIFYLVAHVSFIIFCIYF